MRRLSFHTLKKILDERTEKYNNPDFIFDDPISIPHRFSLLQDVEIAGLFAAVFSWGQRKTIISKTNHLLSLMDDAPYEFITKHTEKDLAKMKKFVHRTFNTSDLYYFIEFLNIYYSSNNSLEDAFAAALAPEDENIGTGLVHFHKLFFSLDEAPERTRKHIPTPEKNSACKRLNMFLRWMVRRDNKGVDFGKWDKIKPSQLLCPLDVHSGNVARHFGLLERKQNDWKATLELTSKLKILSPEDPVQYDFALFGAGVNNEIVY